MNERRFDASEQKFATQRQLTYAVVWIFFLAAAWTFYHGTESQQATVLQTIINLVIAGFSYWIGSSKGSAEAREQLNKLIGPQPGTTTIAPPSNVTVTTETKDAKPPATP